MTDAEKILDVLIDQGYLKGIELIPADTSTKGHGTCCYCGTCGRFHDECVCSHNELLAAINNVLLEK